MPPIIRKYFGQIRESDQQSRDLISKIEVESRAYLAALRKVRTKDAASGPGSAEQLQAIRDKYNQALKLSDAKLEYAASTYRIVDSAIQKLDADLKKFEAEMAAQAPEGGSSASATQIAEIISTAGASASSSSNKKRGRLMKSNTAAPAASTVQTNKKFAGPARRRAGDSTDIDMPIDPNEPLYCICRTVSYGDMVCCDNDDCPFEWFHFDCVGITRSPAGIWLCPECREKKK